MLVLTHAYDAQLVYYYVIRLVLLSYEYIARSAAVCSLQIRLIIPPYKAGQMEDRNRATAKRRCGKFKGPLVAARATDVLSKASDNHKWRH